MDGKMAVSTAFSKGTRTHSTKNDLIRGYMSLATS